MAVPTKKNQTDLSNVPDRFKSVDPVENPKEGEIVGVAPEYQNNLYAVPNPPERENKKDENVTPLTVPMVPKA